MCEMSGGRPLNPLLRLRGCLRRAGYGVQSPFAYRFMRDVVVAPVPYSIYDELPGGDGSRAGEQLLREDRFLLRLSNFVQPELICCTRGVGERARQYLAAGCRRAVFGEPTGSERALLVARGDVGDRADRLSDDSAVCMLGLRDNAAAWRRLKKAGRVVESFDLHVLGVVFFDRRLSPRAYVAYL